MRILRPAMRSILPLISLFLLAGCAGMQSAAPDNQTPAVFQAAAYADLPGWYEENWDDFDQAYARSCARLAKKDPARALSDDARFGLYRDWQAPCAAYAKLNKADPSATRVFFEHYFTPYAIKAGTQAQGLFTGYYEASLKGSRTRSARYNVPLHARPSDLVMVNLGEFRDELKGQRLAGRVIDGNLKPYETRAQIVAGALPENDVLVWVDDPVDAFFVQVQGSGIVELDDGSTMRIGYAGQNGHIYYAIGRELVKRGEMQKDDVSLQTIRTWLAEHPDAAADLMNTNPSYVFFREMDGAGPVGGEGVALTPLRSLAIDHGKFPYGFPLWVTTEEPKLRRMMMAQDTGGAIRGAVRGDVFWGYGDEAEAMAGTMKSPGRYWILLPKTIQF